MASSVSFPARKLFDNGGRSYGTVLSAERIANSPVGSASSTSCLAAYPATIPPPKITIFDWFISGLRLLDGDRSWPLTASGVTVYPDQRSRCGLLPGSRYWDGLVEG